MTKKPIGEERRVFRSRARAGGTHEETRTQAETAQMPLAREGGLLVERGQESRSGAAAEAQTSHIAVRITLTSVIDVRERGNDMDAFITDSDDWDGYTAQRLLFNLKASPGDKITVTLSDGVVYYGTYVLIDENDGSLWLDVGGQNPLIVDPQEIESITL